MIKKKQTKKRNKREIDYKEKRIHNEKRCYKSLKKKMVEKLCACFVKKNLYGCETSFWTSFA